MSNLRKHQIALSGQHWHLIFRIRFLLLNSNLMAEANIRSEQSPTEKRTSNSGTEKTGISGDYRSYLMRLVNERRSTTLKRVLTLQWIREAVLYFFHRVLYKSTMRQYRDIFYKMDSIFIHHAKTFLIFSSILEKSSTKSEFQVHS